MDLATSRVGRRGGRPSGLVGMVALVVAVELFVGRHALDVRTSWAWDWVVALRALRVESASVEVLGFGDSLMKYGMAPAVIEHRTGMRAYNLALGGAQATASLVMLRKALATGARPSAVVVDFAPMLLVEPLQPSPLWPELLGARDLIALAWRAGDAGFLARTALAGLLPSVKGRNEIRGIFRDGLAGRYVSNRHGVVTYCRNWRVNRGGQVMAPSAWSGDSKAEECVRLFGSDARPLDPLNVAAVRQFLRLASSRAIPVYWLLPPLDPEVQSRRDRAGIDGPYLELARRMVAEFPDLRVVDARHSGYGRGVHVDPLHLDRRGTAALSEALAAILARSDRSERWIDLPTYRPCDGPLEDSQQSWVAVTFGEAKRR